MLFTYDAANRMEVVTDWDLQETSYTYDAAGRPLTTNLPNGVISSYSYDEAGRLLSIFHEAGAQLLSSIAYEYDAVGNRVRAVENMLLPETETPTPTPTDTPVWLPLVSAFPDVPSFTPGTQDFDVPQGGSLTLDPGSYGLLKARLGSTVTFTGGVYDFSEWDVGENVQLHFRAPSEIRIAGKLAVDQGSYLGPEPGSSGLDAQDIVIYVTGINGSSGDLGASPKAAKFGIASEVHANVYVPNGTLWLRQNGQFTGAFLGKWVDLGVGTTAEHLSQWTEGSGGSASLQQGERTAVASASSSQTSSPGSIAVASLGSMRRPLFSPLLQLDTETPTPTPTDSPTPTPTDTPMSTDTPTATSTDEPAPTTTPTSPPSLYSVVIDYTYDPLQRLIGADYSTGEFFHYSYDAVGNRLTQEAPAGTNTYAYDIANRLIEVDGIPYSWENNGNLLDDGARQYSYDHVNPLISVKMGDDTYEFDYNGLGDRLRQTVNGAPTLYTLHLAAGLTQVLADADRTYLYGVGRVGAFKPAGAAYYVQDAVGSVRQITDASAGVQSARSFEPFGNQHMTLGSSASGYGFTGEWADDTGLVHLRARYYMRAQGRFIGRDTWEGASDNPMSFNAWSYVYANPVNLTDPSGHDPWWCDYLSYNDEDVVRCRLEHLASLLYVDQSGGNGSGAPLPPPRCGPPPTSATPPQAPAPDACPGPGCTYIGNYNLSAYYAPLEVEYPGDKVRVHATQRAVDLYGGKYLGNSASCQGTRTGPCYVNETELALSAKAEFLYRSDSICEQGMGRVEDGRYISCTTVSVTWDGMPANTGDIRFEWKGEPGRFVAFETAARNPGNEILEGAGVYIPELVTILEGLGLSHPNLDGLLTVTDVGMGLGMNTIDVYIGEGQAAFSQYYDIVRAIENTPVYLRP